MIAGELFDQLPGFDDLFRIEAGGRLVEDEHVGIVDQRLSETDTLTIAFRQLRRQAARHVVDARAHHHLLHALAPFGRWNALDFGDERQVFVDGHVRVEGRRFGKVAGAPLGFDRLVDGLPVGRRQEAGEDAHRRGLAGAVRSEKAEDFAPLHAETDIVDRGDAAVALREVLHLDHDILLSAVPARPNMYR